MYLEDKQVIYLYTTQVSGLLRVHTKCISIQH